MKPSDPEPAAKSSALDWAARTGLSGAVLVELERRAARRRRRAVAGAMLAAACVAVLVWRGTPVRTASVPPAAATVTVREPARRVLDDGSVVELRDQAHIQPDFDERFRRLRLTAGEAHFQVAKNPARPFIVEAAGVRVRAVGTAFTVRPGPAAVEVLVTEGRIAIDLPGEPEDVPTYANAGSRVVIDLAGKRADVQASSTDRLAEDLAWRRPRLEFSGTPLRDVVATFNRHNATRLALAPGETGDLRLSGIIRADNIEALLQLLETNYGFASERRTDGLIVLRRTGR